MVIEEPEVEAEAPAEALAPAPAYEPPATAEPPEPAEPLEPTAPAYDPPAAVYVPSPAAEPTPPKPRVSKEKPARVRRRRTGGRVWRRRRPARARSSLRTGTWRRSRTRRSASDRSKRGSRNLRRLYPPLLVLLLIVVVIGLVDRGGGHSSNTSAQSTNAPRSVFPTPSAVPTAAPPPAVTSTPAIQPQPVAAQPKACRPLEVNGHAVSVSIVQGQVSCQSARAVVRAFKSGKGRQAGQYVTVRGWRCVANGTCTRAGKSIEAS